MTKDDSDNRRQTGLICAALALAVAAAYWPVWQCGFVGLDDYDYVVKNDAIQHGLNWRAAAWAFTTTYAGNWHPLTWFSHLLDFQLYGLNAAGHHATSLLLHAANSILLFLLLKRMTGAMGLSAMVAALFALHPMHVESVAWIAERKDVLSTFFWMLSVWAYVRYGEECKMQNAKCKIFYALALACFALGLMSKPMVVTLPVILLLLDYWPLARWRPPRAPLWAEKVPFFILAAASSVITVVAQQQGRSVTSLEHVPLATRLENLPVGCARYVEKLFWPGHLAVMYPFVFAWPFWEWAGAAAVLAGVTAWVIWRARAQPFLAVGWMWFLAGLAPVNGLVQVGLQSMADRYTYLPSVGLFLMAAWAVGQWRGKLGRRAGAALGTAALAGCLYLTPRQAACWRNTRTLFAHAVENTKDNYFACAALGRIPGGERAEGGGAGVPWKKRRALRRGSSRRRTTWGASCSTRGGWTRRCRICSGPRRCFRTYRNPITISAGPCWPRAVWRRRLASSKPRSTCGPRTRSPSSTLARSCWTIICRTTRFRIWKKPPGSIPPMPGP